MVVLTLFGPPEPEDQKVIGTADAVNYFPKLNQRGQLLWEQRPGLTPLSVEWSYHCSPQSYPWEHAEEGNEKSHWEIGSLTLTAANLWISATGDVEPRILEYTLAEAVTWHDIGLTYRNQARSQIRLQVYDAANNLIRDSVLPNALEATTLQLTGLPSIGRIRLICEPVG